MKKMLHMKWPVWLVTLALVLLYAAQFAGATEPKDFVGTWAMQIGSRNLFVLTLTQNSDGLRGTFDRPQHLGSNNNLFANIGGGIRHDSVVESRLSDGSLRLTTRNANDAKDEDKYVMTIHGDHAELAYDIEGIFMEPHVFVRTPEHAEVSTDWEANRTYVQGDSDTPNSQMKQIFDEDQRVREAKQIDWTVVGKSDGERRDQTRKLLAAGALHTGADFKEAAFVFQHGSTPQDYLLAHTLAMVAVSKGDPTAIWIASATLDRYLENIGQKQVYGTQFNSKGNDPWTQEPYDRDLISDALRRQLGVPSQQLQQRRLESLQSGK